jgi:hypothetical protein
MPRTVPEAASTDATEVAELLQVPPVVALESVIADPAHSELAPVIAATVGTVFTVID